MTGGYPVQQVTYGHTWAAQDCDRPGDLWDELGNRSRQQRTAARPLPPLLGSGPPIFRATVAATGYLPPSPVAASFARLGRALGRVGVAWSWLYWKRPNVWARYRRALRDAGLPDPLR